LHQEPVAGAVDRRFQMKYCASAIQPNRPTSKLSTESVSDLIASSNGASRPTWPRSGAITKYWKRIPKIQASGRSRMYSGPSAAVEPIVQAVARTIHSPATSPSTQPAPQWLSESDTCHDESTTRRRYRPSVQAVASAVSQETLRDRAVA